MITYILWALGLYFVYVSVHAVTRINASKGDKGLLAYGLGPRDGLADLTAGAARCGRAQKNMEESLFFFLPLALLLIITGKADGMGLTGALIFVIARVAYLPAYMIGVPAVRTLIWAGGLAGMVMMLLRLIG